MVDTAFQVAGTFTPRQGRQVQGVVMAGATAARPLGGLSGVRPGTSPTTVSVTSTTVTVGPFAGDIDAQTAAEAAPYEFAFDTITTMALTAQDPSNPRSDIVYARINDNAEDGGGATGAVRVYQAGTAGLGAPIPVPSVSPVTRASVVAVINVPKVGGGAPTVTWVAPYTVAAGGIQPVPVGVYPASPYLGQYVDDATAGLLRWNGTGWVPGGGLIFGSLKRSGSNYALGNGTATLITDLVTDVSKGVTVGTGAGSLTIVTPGYYEIAAGIQFDTNATGLRQMYINKNAATFVAPYVASTQAAGAASSPTTLSVRTPPVLLAAGDVLRMWAAQNCGTGLAVRGDGTTPNDASATYFAVRYLGS